jgi:hypothetical protein
MRGRGWLPIVSSGLGAFLLSGCLHSPPAAKSDGPRADDLTLARHDEKADPNPLDPSSAKASSDYLISASPPVKPPARPTPAPLESVELRIKPQEAQPPAQPADPPRPRVDLPSAPVKADDPLVQALRAILEHHSAEEVKEQLKSFDAETSQALLVLLASAAELEIGGVEHLSPRDLTGLLDRLNILSMRLRARAPLILDHMCFCNRIESFGKYWPLDQYCFQPGDMVKVYVEVRNFASQREGPQFNTVLKGRMEIYEENQTKPFLVRDCEPQADPSRTARQDFFVNFRFPIPASCPPGSYTLRIHIEDQTPTADGKKLKPRSAHSSLDFRVGGPIMPYLRAATSTPAR